MLLRRSIVAIALVALLGGALAARAETRPPRSLFAGAFELRGATDDGRATSIELAIDEADDGSLALRRTARISGGRAFTWTARASSRAPLALDASFDAGESDGLAKALGGVATARRASLAASYRLSPDGLRIEETVESRARGRSTAKGARVLGELTYGELAALALPPLFEDLRVSLAAIGPRTQPPDVRDPRRRVGIVRDFVDVFAFAYPRDGEDDTWREIRDELDRGYETMGAFKDLFDAQGIEDPSGARYEREQLAARRASMLAWLDRFSKPKRLARFADYLAQPKRHRLERRDLARFYWREAGLEPDERLSGVANLARLERALLAIARDDLAETEDLREIAARKKTARAFHGFRKSLRCTYKLGATFPQIFERGAAAAPLVAFVTDVTNKYGDLTDRLCALELARERDDEKDAAAIEAEIERRWSELRAWQRANDVDGALKSLRKMVRND